MEVFSPCEGSLTNPYYHGIPSLFGKAKCKRCGNDVRFALRHLKQKHPEVLDDKDVARLNMSKVIEKYFD
jgi:hypothetical protein